MTSYPLSSWKKKPGLQLLLLLGLLALVFTACGGSTTTAHKNVKQAPLVIVANTNGDYTRVFNPYSPNANSGAQSVIYESLLFYNRIDKSVTPWLAQSQELSSDATVVTYHLRQGVKWSDGEPFTSDDVLFTFNLLKKYPAMDLNGIWSFIKSVAAPDSNTFVVTLNSTYTPVLWYIGGETWILSKHKWSSVSGDPSQYADPNPVGTGPYMLKSFSPQTYDLTKNPHYWQPGKPEVNDLAFPAYDSNTSAELALNRGKIDWAGIYIPDIQKTYISRDPAHNHYWFPPSDIVLLYVNTAKFPFNQLAVRQAVSDTIDRNQLYKVAESGYEPPASPTGLVLPNDKDYVSPEYAGLSFTVDTARAAQRLEGAGFTKGPDGIYADKSGKKLSFTLNVVTGWNDWITACQIIAKELNDLGMHVTVNTATQDAWYNALQNGDYTASLLWTNPGPSPYYIYDGLLRSTNSAPIGQAANSNFERWTDPATDKLLDTYATAVDPNVQKQAIAGIEKIMVEQLPSIPLTEEPFWNEYNTQHFVGWPDAQHQYAEPGPFAFPDMEVTLLHLHPAG
jgi:peptide/nickel transport system substrate-binding protein